MSQGFGQWFADVQSEGKNEVVNTGADSWNWFSGEKKNDGEPGDVESLLPKWVQDFRETAADATGLKEQESSLFGMSYQTRFKGFVASVMLASFFFVMAFLVGLPLVVVRPSKFALCFTTGSLLFMSSFAFLKGPMTHLRSMVSPERLFFTGTYLSSMAFTLYAALFARSYIMVVVASGLQISTLAYYMLSFIPGGTAGAHIFVMMFFKTARATAGASIAILNACIRMVTS